MWYPQATALYKESESEKEGVIAKLGVLEEERKKLIEEITTAEQKLKETSRVCIPGFCISWCNVCLALCADPKLNTTTKNTKV